MPLVRFLYSKNLISKENLQAVRKRQSLTRLPIKQCLIDLNCFSSEELNRILYKPPSIPLTLEETGLSEQFLLGLILKTFLVRGYQTVSEISGEIAISPKIVEETIQKAKKQALVEVLGSGESLMSLRYQLTIAGNERARAEVKRSQYVGPAPVTLSQYQVQIQKQSVSNETITKDTLKNVLSHLVLSSQIRRQLGPALNSGKPILLYGPTGNGKTSISEALGDAFNESIFIPHCFEVGNQIIRVYDQSVHSTSDEDSDGAYDKRWIKCRRPVIMAGGELTLEMLDLRIDSFSNDYEAPLQVKASGGILVIDDLGRQLVSPTDLLNRWVVPLERKIDYLTLASGKKFEIPFDELVIFSTNIPPKKLMDNAFLRRIHYKFWLGPPAEEDYRQLFNRVCQLKNVSLPPDILNFIMDDFYSKMGVGLAAFHPQYILDHVIAACLHDEEEPALDLSKVRDALSNLQIVAE